MYTCRDYELEKLFIKWAYRTSLETSKTYYQSLKLYVKRKWNKEPVQVEPLQTSEIRDDGSLSSEADLKVDEIISQPITTVSKESVVPYNDYGNKYAVFKKRTTQLNMSLCQTYNNDEHYIISPNVDDIDQPSHLCLILFSNKDTNQFKTAYLPSEYVNYLSHFQEMGIHNIDIQNVSYFPDKPLVNELADLYKLNEYKDVSTFLSTLADMYKILHMKQFKGLYYKAILEYLYNSYEFTTEGTVKFDEMFREFETYHTPALEQLPLSVILNKEAFHKMMGLLGFSINNNQIRYLTKKNTRNKVSLLKTSKVHSIIKDNKKMNQLRLEPVIDIKPIGPWHLSSSIF